MKILLLFFSLFSVSLTTGDSTYREVKNYSFGQGEKLEYRIHYGLVSAAEAIMEVDDAIHYVNGRPCYKISIQGNSTGVFDMFTTIRNEYGSYIDTASVITHRFYRYIREGKYRKNEQIDFLQLEDKARVSKLAKDDKEKVTEVKEFMVPDNVQDMVSGYYFMRTLDYSGMNPGDTLVVDAFFDNEVYDFKIKFLGREELKTKLGTFNSLVLAPIMPSNKLFDGANAVQVWITDDPNKIPLKIRAKLLVGAVEVDIKSYENVRN